MGFYAPHTLVEDAKRHGVEVRGSDVCASGWESALEGAAPGAPAAAGEAPAIRLGLHLVRGLPRAVGDAIVGGAARAPVRATSATSSGAPASRVPGSCGSPRRTRSVPLAPDRRSAVWRSLAMEADGRRSRSRAITPAEPDAPLPPSSAAEEVSADFATTGLSVRGHPMAILRGTLPGGVVRTARELARLPDRAPVEVAGLVIVRQRPQTAAGIVFVSLEDETGIANLVVMPDVYERFRAVVRGAPFLVARGQVERSGEVVNVRVRSVAPLALAPQVGNRAREFR